MDQESIIFLLSFAMIAAGHILDNPLNGRHLRVLPVEVVIYTLLFFKARLDKERSSSCALLDSAFFQRFISLVSNICPNGQKCHRTCNFCN